MKSQTLSKSERQELIEESKELFGDAFFGKKDLVRRIESEHGDVYTVDGEAVLARVDDALVPLLKYVLRNEVAMKNVTVDMGAVKPLVSGADCMAPGILDADPSIESGDVVLVLDVENKKPIVIGKAVVGGEELRESTQGRVVENLHYVGDAIWGAF